MSQITQIQAFNGQSNFDVCLRLYGTLDYFINLLSSNSISSSQTLSTYLKDNNLKNINSNITGINYATSSKDFGGSSGSGVYGGAYGGAFG